MRIKLGIDVITSDVHTLIVRLKNLPSTVWVEDGGAYKEDATYSQVWLTTTKTLHEIDEWLYTLVGISYVGVFSRGVDG